MPHAFRFLGSIACVCLLVLGGCSGTDDPSALGDWTKVDGELALTEDLQVSETDAFYFGSIRDLDVTSDGRMVVADGDASNIKVLRPDGALIDTLGRAGEGPGEFQRLASVQIARGDSLYAYDPLRLRLTVFTLSQPYEMARTVTIPREEGAAATVHVLGSQLVGSFSSGGMPEEGVAEPAPDAWRVIDESGTPGDTLTRSRQQKMVMTSVNGGFVIRSLPFGRETLAARGPDSKLYLGWADSLRVVAHSIDDTSEVVASVPTERVPVTTAARDSALSGISSDMRSMIESAMPGSKPAFTDLVVADDGQLWVERPVTAPNAETVRWWVLDPETKTIHEVELDADVDLEVVQNGNAYGSTTTKLGAPAVVRYQIEQTA